MLSSFRCSFCRANPSSSFLTLSKFPKNQLRMYFCGMKPFLSTLSSVLNIGVLPWPLIDVTGLFCSAPPPPVAHIFRPASLRPSTSSLQRDDYRLPSLHTFKRSTTDQNRPYSRILNAWLLSRSKFPTLSGKNFRIRSNDNASFKCRKKRTNKRSVSNENGKHWSTLVTGSMVPNWFEGHPSALIFESLPPHSSNSGENGWLHSKIDNIDRRRKMVEAFQLLLWRPPDVWCAW